MGLLSKIVFSTSSWLKTSWVF